MTNISAIHQYQNQAAFEMLRQIGFSAQSYERADGVKLDLTDTDDDVVMLQGDNIEITANGGNNTVLLSGDNNNLTAGDGKNTIALCGSNSKAVTGTGDDNFYLEGNNLSVETSGGDNNFRIYGDNNNVTAGDGKNTIGMIGNYNTLALGAKKQNIAFWGNYNNISMGDGGSSVMTIDHALKTNAKKWADLEDRWIQKLDTFNTSEKINSQIAYDYDTCTNAVYAALSDEDKAFMDTIDLMETIKFKKHEVPKYVIGANPDGEPTLYVYSYTYRKRNYYYPRGHEGEQEFKTTIISNVVETEAAYGKYEAYDMEYSKNYEIEGVSGNNVKFGDGDNTLKWTISSVGDDSKELNMGNAKTGHTLEQQQTYTFADKSAQSFTKYEVVNKKFYMVPAEEEQEETKKKKKKK